jgi:hypothetical protein
VTNDRGGIHVRRYWNFDATAEVRKDGGNQADKFVTWEAGSTDAVVKIHAAAKVAGTNQGQFVLGEMKRVPSSRVQAHRHLAIEFEGVKGGEQVVIHKIAQSGTGK